MRIRVFVTVPALFALTIALGIPGQAQTYTESTLYSFVFPPSAGMWPWGGLIMDSAGTLYGTTYAGGSAICSGGCGTVFKFDTSGTYTVLHEFTGPDGENPQQPLTMDTAGNLYSTVFGVGPSANGIVYRIDTAGTFSIVHRFSGGDGSFPEGPVIFDGSGNLYGTMGRGGLYGDGVVFKIDTAGVETSLYNFKGTTDGDEPSGRLLLDNLGNLYGTASGGGNYGSGVVFKLSPAGEQTAVYSFCRLSGCADGANPYSGLIRSTSGALYGIAGGGETDHGVVFQISGGAESVLYSFCPGGTSSTCRDGATPTGILLAPWGKIYGTTQSGGNGGNSFNDPGVLFSLTLSGAENVLYRFPANPFYPQGGNPESGMIMDSIGNLYGTLYSGGSTGEGAIFKLTKN